MMDVNEQKHVETHEGTAIKVSEIVEFLSRHTEVLFLGSPNKEVGGFASLMEAEPSHIAFCSYKGDREVGMVKSSNAGVIMCHHSHNINKNLILVKDPRFWFTKVVRKFFLKRNNLMIHPTAVINDCVKIGKNVRIGPNCSIGFGGFGFSKDENGVYERFPHIGKVLIGDNVEIGSNVCIDRGALSDTVVGEGTKIDNLVHIAHNVKIGKNCCVVALSCIGGSVEIGNNAYVGIGVSIRDQIKIGDNVFIGMGAVVTKDCLDPGVYIGVPAVKKNETIK